MNQQYDNITFTDYKKGKKLMQSENQIVQVLEPEKEDLPGLVIKLKMINQAEVETKNKESVYNEFQILQMLDHENIIKALSFEERLVIKNKIQMVFLEKMDLDLFKYIKEIFPVIATQKIRSFFQQISLAIQYLHQKNMVHCDIKPENIGISEELAVLMDFEYASQIQEFQRLTKVKETWKNRSVIYQSPQVLNLVNLLAGNNNKLGQQELFQVVSKIDFNKNDVFSLGVALFSCLFYTNPLQNGSASKTDPIYKFFYKKQFEKVWEIQQVSIILEKITAQGENIINLKKLLIGMLQYEQSERFTIEQVLSSEWFKKI